MAVNDMLLHLIVPRFPGAHSINIHAFAGAEDVDQSQNPNQKYDIEDPPTDSTTTISIINQTHPKNT